MAKDNFEQADLSALRGPQICETAVTILVFSNWQSTRESDFVAKSGDGVRKLT
jgi:hypothetical protein